MSLTRLDGIFEKFSLVTQLEDSNEFEQLPVQRLDFALKYQTVVLSKSPWGFGQTVRHYQLSPVTQQNPYRQSFLPINYLGLQSNHLMIKSQNSSRNPQKVV